MHFMRLIHVLPSHQSTQNTLIQTKVIFISAKTNLWLKEVKQLSITVVFFLKFHLII